ncbi:sensor histidine kinase [Bartonella sp. DGB1]|uniref:sensor histidine kinase n=1 Tax=Bartonella sp. DGB1 TaxID=3239807 RepID=UPI003523AB80
MSESFTLLTETNPNIALEHPDVLLQALVNSGICLLYQTPDLIYQWAENLPAILQEKYCHNYRDSNIFPTEISERLETIKLDILSTGKSESIELNFNDIFNNKKTPKNIITEEIWYKLTIACHKDDQQRILGLITTIINISHLKHREKILKILLREVSHRSKNLLAIVESLARQTARYSSSPNQFMQEFEGRIQSLSLTQDLVTDANWLGVKFKQLVNIQLQDKLCHKAELIEISGDNPNLFPNSTLYIGLALHELARNSKKNGAIKKGQGKLKISCQRQLNENKEPVIKIRWQEFYPAIQMNNIQTTSFSNIILTKIVPTAVNGYICYEFGKENLTYELSIPHTQFE